MSTPTYIAWSFVAAGALALLFFVIERYVRRPDARLVGGIKNVAAIVALTFFGAILVRETSYFFLTIQPPTWTRLLSSAVPLVLGLFFLVTAPDRKTRASLRVYAGILIAIGAVTLALDSYRYAISLGTAASVSLS